MNWGLGPFLRLLGLVVGRQVARPQRVAAVERTDQVGLRHDARRAEPQHAQRRHRAHVQPKGTRLVLDRRDGEVVRS